ncbi:phosphoribosylformylglycinamidine cyclo-ligase [Aliifodinibius sp. S!AR15-10]|uniref:phosphoribosylformylglycinamidine cyclo-ligase n=1 Tax=Aliifodinibius sp. S!AR15-10 TaxID=2950437 RepID=UPI0028602F7D|nr:phosphoribosylformylglycinamidine cyclo-ligase [Aliifodinibius sp. S!AR15-10]MDR8391318.1 phosphoribosylformylglycinamidine cyclo-ligase [Aliifodinibius sp. S!AR15-10]
MSKKKSITYKDSGVDIEAGEEMVNSIKGVVRETHNASVLTDIGGFGGFFRPDLANFDDPVFVSSVDGVGTKLIVAFKTERYDTVGQDLVNHCVNDIAVCGAQPLFFLDYFSTGKLKQNVGYDVVKGFSKACKENGVALIGGETAEMPDIYSEGEFDLAGTIVGIVDRDEIINGKNIQKGDLLLGFESSGLHTNGYSLARKVLFSEYDVSDHVEQLGTTVGDAMLSVHRSYLSLISELKGIDEVNGFSHITGGGIVGNTKRILPEGRSLDIDWDSWDRPAIFKLIQELGNVPEDDMRATFNLGIGLIAVVDPEAADEVRDWAEKNDESIYELGTVK